MALWDRQRTGGRSSVRCRARAPPHRVEVPLGAVFLAAPLLSLQRVDSVWLLLVARCHIRVGTHSGPRISVIVEELWTHRVPEIAVDLPAHEVRRPG
jgi:hypothetical protein